jgi:hypothetical protein
MNDYTILGKLQHFYAKKIKKLLKKQSSFKIHLWSALKNNTLLNLLLLALRSKPI